MAYYHGYVTIPHQTYAEWKQEVLNNFYDADQIFNYQCMDLVMEFWWNVGFPQAYPHTSTGNADGVWSKRAENLSYGGTTYFETVLSKESIKKGDIICYSTSPYGHIGFADIDYDAWTPDPDNPYEFPILSQNNGGLPDPSGTSAVNVAGYDIRDFQGAFRYIPWNTTPPTPPHPVAGRGRTNFPWVLYARKLRNKM